MLFATGLTSNLTSLSDYPWDSRAINWTGSWGDWPYFHDSDYYVCEFRAVQCLLFLLAIILSLWPALWFGTF